MALPMPSRPPRVERWRSTLPPELVDALEARPAAVEAFDRLTLAEIRDLVRWVGEAPSPSERRGRVKRVLSGLSRPTRRPPAA